MIEQSLDEKQDGKELLEALSEQFHSDPSAPHLGKEKEYRLKLDTKILDTIQAKIIDKAQAQEKGSQQK